jgi:hypothetical protein
MEVHCRDLLVSKNNLESLVFLFLDFQGWNPNFKWLKIFNLPLNKTMDNNILELSKNSNTQFFIYSRFFIKFSTLKII